jgi:hypothetical protein
MSMQPDGSYVCDRDGVDVGNGSVLMALVVSDLDPDNPGHVRNLHFCRDREDEDGKIVKGCARKVLSSTNMKHYTETKESSGGGQAS